MCSRPAVSTISASRLRAVAALTASNTTAPGSEPAAWRIDLDVDALAPALELLDRGRAEGVGGGQDHALARPLQRGGQLGRGRGLARAVDAEQQHDGGPMIEVERPTSRARACRAGSGERAGRSWLGARHGPEHDFLARPVDEVGGQRRRRGRRRSAALRAPRAAPSSTGRSVSRTAPRLPARYSCDRLSPSRSRSPRAERNFTGCPRAGPIAVMTARWRRAEGSVGR